MKITKELLNEKIETISKRYHSITPGIIGSTSTQESRPIIIGKIQMLRELIEILDAQDISQEKLTEAV